MEKGMNTEEISEELGIPLSSTYRKIRDLKAAGMLVIERREFTDGGNLCDVYRCPVRGMRIELDASPPSVDLTFIEEPPDKVYRVWKTLRSAR
jgi:predicted transcriptional regulator